MLNRTLHTGGITSLHMLYIYHHLALFYLTVTGYNYVRAVTQLDADQKKEIDAGRLHASHTSGDLSLLVLPRDRVRWQQTLAAPFFHGWRIHSDVLHIPDICWVTHVVDAINHQESHKTDDIDREVYNSISSLPTVRRCSIKFDSRSSGRFFLRRCLFSSKNFIFKKYPPFKKVCVAFQNVCQLRSIHGVYPY